MIAFLTRLTGCAPEVVERDIAFHARWLGIAYRVCLWGGATLLSVCAAAQLATLAQS